MRRAGFAAALGILGIWGAVAAEPWKVTMEGGAEADSNVQRMGGTVERIAAPVGRAGARIAHKGRLVGGGYVLGLSGLARMVASERAQTESVMLFTGDARWLRPLEGRSIAAGASATVADAAAIMGGTGARTFRNLGGDGLLALGGGDNRRLLLAVGARAFWYKPNPMFDWRGPVAHARLDVVLWQSPSKIRSLELATTFGFEARSYNSDALKNICPPDGAPSTECSTSTTLRRRDRYQRAAAELNWTSEVVVSTGYQFTVIDSNSYGQSLIRHRITTSATTELVDKLFGTATATLQIDQYPDGIFVEDDIQHQELTNLEDENRSSLQVRIARELTPAWSLEVRGAIWRDFGHTDATFRRELLYTGVIYAP